MKNTINAKLYMEIQNAISNEFVGWGSTATEIMFETMEYILGIIELEDIEYSITLKIIEKLNLKK